MVQSYLILTLQKKKLAKYLNILEDNLFVAEYSQSINIDQVYHLKMIKLKMTKMFFVVIFKQKRKFINTHYSDY